MPSLLGWSPFSQTPSIQGVAYLLTESEDAKGRVSLIHGLGIMELILVGLSTELTLQFTSIHADPADEHAIGFAEVC